VPGLPHKRRRLSLSPGLLCAHARAALGRSYLRLDCEADRQELRAVYEDSVSVFTRPLRATRPVV
jgi:hypothetical protein